MGELRMSAEEWIRRLDASKRVKRGEPTVVVAAAAAAELMRLSLRQARRVWKRFEAAGDAGLVHGHRGRPGNRRMDPKGGTGSSAFSKSEGFGSVAAAGADTAAGREPAVSRREPA